MRNLRLRSFIALFLLTAANGWTRPVIVPAAAPLAGSSELTELTRGQLPVGMLVRASLATARELPPGQTATPFAALNAGLDPVSSECLCLRKGNPGINGRGSLGLPSRYTASGDAATEASALVAGVRIVGLTMASAEPLERDPSARELGSQTTERLTLTESRDETIVAKWELQGESGYRAQVVAMGNGAAGSSGIGGGAGSGASTMPVSEGQTGNGGRGEAALEAAPDQPASALALGEWKTGLTPDSGIVGLGTTTERTLVALAAATYLPGATPVAREAAAVSQRITLLQKSYPTSVPSSDMAAARAPAWVGGSQEAASGGNSGRAWGGEGQWAPGVPWRNMPAAAQAGGSQQETVAEISRTLEATVATSSAKPVAPEEAVAVAAVAGVDLLMVSAPPPVEDVAALIVAPAADPLAAAVNNPEPGTLVLLSIGALLVMVSQIGKRRKTS